MSKNRTLRTSALIGALAAGLMSATAFAQTPSTTAPAAGANTVPPGYTQVQPPKDPLVERREQRREARQEYAAEKKAAKSEYKQDVNAAKQERKDAYKAANEQATQQLQQGTKQ
ncbi:hypothetical protein [Cupriavidus plantarum]|uniref:Uncharacterized protein n=1 Tax=Cupriavidus plantarum TaxID=942865 RepID=A0A316F1V2_9BURK|nr:hypothetical protein [Cupriavidus plantarum]PWK37499.1 hypothetical protein C7419_1011381 [Cupriavidus plantarum]REF01756.1 hypothetical protein C7418_0541 [Cupriavidus plantarum]RLK45383.1 hypothetical protein C7417_1399 [Cupriavidus plantarum]CAG2128263.1 hypothetical protein LMG26296_01313 [Cupriavidus plantarum]SMR66555.1 hypothetical protein SAMN05421735_1439 [Cupriavidus plantarum]